MFFYTDTAGPPWIIVKPDGKKRARPACMQHFLPSLPYRQRDTHAVHGPGPLIGGPGGHVIGRSGHIPGKSLHPAWRHANHQDG